MQNQTLWTQAQYFERQDIEADRAFAKEPSRSPGENHELTALDGQFRLGQFLFDSDTDMTLAAVHFADHVEYEQGFRVSGRTMTMLEANALITAGIVDPLHKSRKWIRDLQQSLENGEYYG